MLSLVRLGLVLLFACAAPAHAARLALLIGNDSYKAVTPLENARADAQAMEVALRSVKYDWVDLRRDQDLRSMQAAVRDFKARIKPGDEVVVFFSGHGVQIEGSSYLLPVDIHAANPDDVRDGAITLQRILDDVAEKRPAFTLIVIDACRNNPFTGRRAIGGAGLGPTAAANGQMVVYSAGTGQQALDRLSASDPVRNGLFTRIFVKEMLTPGLPIPQVVDRVRERVRDEALKVKHDQMPALYNQSVGSFYFVPPIPGANPGTAGSGSNETLADIAMWNTVKDSSDPRELQMYLDTYGEKAKFAEIAKSKLQTLQRKRAGGSGTAGSIVKDCAECPELVVVPSGSLKLASADAKSPGSMANLTRPFAIGRYEVTFDEWDACVTANACAAVANDEGWGRGRRPVINVSWNDAIAYVNWLSKKTNVPYRLPSDVEWEYAAGAGSQAKYPWGTSIDPGMANCNGCGAAEFERKKTAPVGTFRPNGYGLFDIVGNVWEWVADCYAAEMKSPPAADNPGGCSTHITRGGSFRTDANTATLQYRRETAGNSRSQQIGFRVARDL